MRHIRNFFHDINDIILAILIVVIAAGVIYWRMQIILDYPKTIVSNQAVTEEQAEEEPAAEEAATEEPAEAASGEEGTEMEETTEASGGEAPAEDAAQ
jgi:hypothetical protein